MHHSVGRCNIVQLPFTSTSCTNNTSTKVLARELPSTAVSVCVALCATALIKNTKRTSTRIQLFFTGVHAVNRLFSVALHR